jgi:hypothetical protein
MYVETDCVVKGNGQAFEAGGAAVSDDVVAGYVKGDDDYIGARGVIVNWHGDQVLGSYVVTNRWATPRSHMASHRCWLRITTNDHRVVYSGSSFGNGMSVVAYRRAK